MVREQWHLDKKVPLGIIIALIVQTITFFSIASSWKASVDGRLGSLEKSLDENDSQGDRIIILEQQLKFIVESLTRIEVKLNAVENGKIK